MAVNMLLSLQSDVRNCFRMIVVLCTQWRRVMMTSQCHCLFPHSSHVKQRLLDFGSVLTVDCRTWYEGFTIRDGPLEGWKSERHRKSQTSLLRELYQLSFLSG